MISIKRIYDTPSEDDGLRVLVDRLWPRGVSKEKATLDLWLKDVAPSTGLREWFGHDPKKFEEFSARYEAELNANPATEQLRGLIKDHTKITLLYGAHDPNVNHAVVLLSYLQPSSARR